MISTTYVLIIIVENKQMTKSISTWGKQDYKSLELNGFS